MDFEKRLKQTLTREIDTLAVETLKKRAVVHSYEPIITYDGKAKIRVSYTRYNMSKYNEIVEGLINDRYSIKEEICLTNKGIKDDNNVEYVAYRNYVDECKAKAKAYIEERDNALANQ